MLVVFSSAYLLSVYFLWWNVVSNLWPIWKVGFLCFYWILQVLHIVCIEVHYLICKYFLCGLLFIFLVVVGCLVTKLCPTPAMDCSLPGSSVHGILQAGILEWVSTSLSRGSSRPRDQTQVSCITGRWFTNWAMKEAEQLLEFAQIHVHRVSNAIQPSHLLSSPSSPAFNLSQ